MVETGSYSSCSCLCLANRGALKQGFTPWLKIYFIIFSSEIFLLCVAMNGAQNGKTCNLEKPFPGCLGRMVNLFDLSTGIARNRLLTDKPHRDGSPLSSSRSDAARMSPIGDPIEDKVIVSELRRSSSNKKSNGTPMKMLIAEEMSKEVESKHNPPSVVAKLMGLDALPQQQSDSAAQKSQSRDHSGSHSAFPSGYWQKEHGFDLQMQHKAHQYPDQDGCGDVYEIWQQSCEGSYGRDKSLQKGRHNENIRENKMALVRQKFVEAKCLAADGKLRQSKQFQDALEVLSSNKDLFLKFLQEPNSMFSQHLYDLQPVPSLPETKRITVLRPSKMVHNNKLSESGKKNDKQTDKASHMGRVIGWDRSNPGFSPLNWKVNDSPAQPTRIVVLKPGPVKPHDIKAVVSPPSSPRLSHGERLYGEPEDDEARESREVAKEITQQMCENLGAHRRDETLLSSVLSNGYIGDESSFNKSENEYAAGNLSDSEIISPPTSRHSWDYISRFDSPHSSSSFSRPYSPESSVCREAKKRLSERWAMLASNGICQEQSHVQRSSSTLGEMLALSDVKNSLRSEEKGINKEQEPRGFTSCSANDFKDDENLDNSPRNLSRSKSVPVSSTVFGGRLDVEVSEPEVSKKDLPKEVAKTRSMKSSFRGKVSSLFFSRNKKSSKEKSIASQSKDESQKSSGTVIHSPGKISDGTSQCINATRIGEGSLPNLQGSSSKTSTPDLIVMGPKQGVIFPEAGFSVTKPVMPGNLSENQDQPSPISVLEPLFEEDDNISPVSCNVKPEKQVAKLAAQSIRSNLIDKSPPIESIARTLSWDDSCAMTATSYQLKPSFVSQGTEEEEREWLFFAQSSLLSAVGLDGEVQSDSFFARWHSPESPLDPSMRDKYIDVNEKEIISEARRRRRRSTQKLVFDCVNEALVDITGYGSETNSSAIPHGGVHNKFSEGASPILADEVWARMKEWFSCDLRCVSGGGGYNYSLVVERVVRKEVVGKGWVEHMRLEIDKMGKELEGKLLDELVQEAVVELIGRV